MSIAPIVWYPGGHRPVGTPILTVQGVDIRAVLVEAAEVARIPPELLLGCIAAESELDARAERWGRLTAQAKAALAAGDTARLRAIIPQVGDDISFGLGQRIVKFHYHGNRKMTLENILDVRQFVFDNTDQDVREAALFLTPCLADAERQTDLSRAGGDVLLGACVSYNHGHYPSFDDQYWTERASTVARYKNKLAWARAQLNA